MGLGIPIRPRFSGRQIRTVTAPGCAAAMLVGLLAATGGTAAAGTTAVGVGATAGAARPTTLTSPVPQTITRRFTYTGDVQTLEIPAGFGEVTVTALGATGGVGGPAKEWNGGAGGAGTLIRADIPLTEATSTLQILVGGNGENGDYFRAGDGGWNGGGSGASAGGAGGGGGASEVRTSSGTPLIVAAGGGGGGSAGAEGPGGRGGPLNDTLNGGTVTPSRLTYSLATGGEVAAGQPRPAATAATARAPVMASEGAGWSAAEAGSACSVRVAEVAEAGTSAEAAEVARAAAVAAGAAPARPMPSRTPLASAPPPATTPALSSK